MTWSIVARDPETGGFGVAVTSCFFAVGALIPYVQAGVGAIATQAMVNKTLGPRGLAMMAEGLAPAEVAESLAQSDQGREVRQLHLVDSQNRTGSYTGRRCPDWAGQVAGRGVSVAGNTLQDEGVARATLAAFEGGSAQAFEVRLIEALQAGQAAGGDRRGRQSAALLVRGRPGLADVDIRVDDHAAPLDELERLLAVYTHDFLPVAQLFPRDENDPGVFDGQAVAEARARRLENRAQGSRSQASLRAAADGRPAERAGGGRPD
jgi:uncharacterized Ntn-hydrolase superfamily protein